MIIRLVSEAKYNSDVVLESKGDLHSETDNRTVEFERGIKLTLT